MTPRQSSSEQYPHSNPLRKRVCKACDRCRLKKSKCDGENPCGRCRADDAICIFGERKKADDKFYPKGYVETLEQQQAWLVYGLQELYQRAIGGEGWPGAPLKCESDGHPLTHDILARLGALDQSKGKRFETNPDTMQHGLWEQNAGYMQRQDPSTQHHQPLPIPPNTCPSTRAHPTVETEPPVTAANNPAVFVPPGRPGVDNLWSWKRRSNRSSNGLLPALANLTISI